MYFKEFVTECQSKIIPSIGTCPDETTCRTMNEMYYIAYLRTKAVKEGLNQDSVYITSAHPNLSRDGVSKILISAPHLSKTYTGIAGAPLLKYIVVI